MYQQEISWILTHCDNLVHGQKSGNVQFTCQQKMTVKFLTLFTPKKYRNEYRMGKNGKTGSDIEVTSPILW